MYFWALGSDLESLFPTTLHLIFSGSFRIWKAFWGRVGWASTDFHGCSPSLCLLTVFVLLLVLVTCIFIWKIKLSSKILYVKHLDICAFCPKTVLCGVPVFGQWAKQFLNLVAQGKKTSLRNQIKQIIRDMFNTKKVGHWEVGTVSRFFCRAW